MASMHRLLALVAVRLLGCLKDTAGSGESEADQHPPDWGALRDRRLAETVGHWRRLGYLEELPSDVRFVRYLEPEEYGAVHAQCMRKQGFDARETFDHGVEFGDIPAEQAPAQMAALYRCEVMYPVHPRYLLPRTEAQLRTVYDYYVLELVPCLRARGYLVSEVPTWEAFLAAERGGGSTWSPYLFVDPSRLSQAQWKALNEECPQGPPLDRLYPGDA